MIYILGAFFSVFLIVILLHKKKSKSDYILILWLLILGLDLSLFYGKKENLILNILNVPFPFFHGLLLFLYTKTLLHFKTSKIIFVVLVMPLFICMIGLFYLFYNQNFSLFVSVEQTTIWGIVYFVLVLLSGFLGVYYSFKTIKEYELKQDENNVLRKLNLKWLRFLIIGIGITWGTIFFNISEITLFFLSLFVMSIGYYGIIKAPIFYEFQISKNSNAFSVIEKVALKKESLLLSEESERQILNRLEKLIDKKMYLKNDFTQQFVAKKIKTNTSYLSHVVNKYYQQSFSSYLNELRINYAIEQIKNNSIFREYTTQAIAETVGFKNADSFTTSFKKKMGVTPFQFINAVKKEKR
ncbi:AraC family transcriptional regulator [Flavobacterium sp. J27]|uniref:helix-turn-helix domain-containing protein n=1 Tax=Flavobacterium sp. J27 TaxID=2060419 RepID=UPI001032019A|nr:helix-turn-helix domain-containing protein [Flavobacterium sp. J27]